MGSHARNQRISPRTVFVNHEPTILGTGGFVQPIKSWIGDSHLLIFNGDIICDIDLDEMIEQHLATKSLATMALVSHHGKTTMIGCEHQTITVIGGKQPARHSYTFTGIHILSPEFIRLLPAHYTFYNVIDTYQTILPTGRVTAYFHSGIWHDLGTPADYYHASMRHLAQFEKIDQRLGIVNLWQKAGRPLKYVGPSTGVAHPAILPRDHHASDLGPNVLAYDSFSMAEGHAENSIIFSSRGNRVNVGNTQGITMDEHFIAVETV
jgi:NDP-sugar pyrophosphorylase family protein